MSNLPNFSDYGYEVLHELGHNHTGGRVVYLAKTLFAGIDAKSVPEDRVVIKQFQFIKGANWSTFREIEREMHILQNLSHPGIPHYIGSFESNDGYCIVQEYKDAKPLSECHSFDADRVKQIAIAVLEILVYLQNRIPAIVHRDIKPENILLDESGNVYLIDFGFARIGTGEVAISSVAAGTFGFMAPEQLRNRELNEATDLYGLGATLICLLTNTRSIAIDTITDDDGRINFQHLVPSLGTRFIGWLEKMAAPKRTDRYLNANGALQALRPISVERSPEVKLIPDRLELKATHIGEKIIQVVMVTNSMPETIDSIPELLEGRWEVAPHPSDPPHTPDAHAWISFIPKAFNGNTANCSIAVDTSLLMAGMTYERQILLYLNCDPGTMTLPISVLTASPLATQKTPYFDLAATLITGTISTASAYYLLRLSILSIFAYYRFDALITIVIYFVGSCLITVGSVAATARDDSFAKASGWTVLGVLVVCLAFDAIGLASNRSWGDSSNYLLAFTAPFLHAMFGALAGRAFKKSRDRGIKKTSALWLVLLTVGVGAGLGILGVSTGLERIGGTALAIASALPLWGMLVRQRKLAARHKTAQRHLIKP
jgi:serine/threonine protein kinase